MLNHEYELTLIIRPDLEDSDTFGIVDKVEGIIGDKGGTLLLRDDWGKRKLAYAIRKHLKGHYVLLNFASPAEVIAEVERRLRNEEPVIRFLTVKVGEQIDVAERVEAARIVQKQKDEEAKARAEAEAEANAPRDDDDDKGNDKGKDDDKAKDDDASKSESKSDAKSDKDDE